MSSQSSKPLYTAAVIFLAAGALHYAMAGWDAQDVLPLPESYDLARDPAADIVSGIAQAKAAHKRVLLEIGGDWCPPCETLDRFLREDPGLGAMAAANYVVVRVAVPQSNTHIPALRELPPIEGYPHLDVLDIDGRLLASKETDDLEKGDSYDSRKVAEFLYAQSFLAAAQAAVVSTTPVAAVAVSSAVTLGSPR